jgi:hypothetical protein
MKNYPACAFTSARTLSLPLDLHPYVVRIRSPLGLGMALCHEGI